MSLANFFYRAEQSLSQTLQAVNPDKLRNILEKKLIAIAFDDKSLESMNSQIILELIVNLTARLYPQIAIIHAGEEHKGEVVINQLNDIAKSMSWSS